MMINTRAMLFLCFEYYSIVHSVYEYASCEYVFNSQQTNTTKWWNVNIRTPTRVATVLPSYGANQRHSFAAESPTPVLCVVSITLYVCECVRVCYDSVFSTFTCGRRSFALVMVRWNKKESLWLRLFSLNCDELRFIFHKVNFSPACALEQTSPILHSYYLCSEIIWRIFNIFRLLHSLYFQILCHSAVISEFSFSSVPNYVR